MNSLCAAAVLALPVRSFLLPPRMPPAREGGALTSCAVQWHSLLLLTNPAVLAVTLACFYHVTSSPFAPLLSSLFPVCHVRLL